AAPIHHEWALQRTAHVVDGRGRHAAAKDLDPFGRRLRRQGGVQVEGELRTVGQPRLEVLVVRVRGPLRPAYAAAQLGPELLLVAHEEDEAIARAIKLAG